LALLDVEYDDAPLLDVAFPPTALDPLTRALSRIEADIRTTLADVCTRVEAGSQCRGKTRAGVTE